MLLFPLDQMLMWEVVTVSRVVQRFLPISLLLVHLWLPSRVCWILPIGSHASGHISSNRADTAQYQPRRRRIWATRSSLEDTLHSRAFSRATSWLLHEHLSSNKSWGAAITTRMRLMEAAAASAATTEAVDSSSRRLGRAGGVDTKQEALVVRQAAGLLPHNA